MKIGFTGKVARLSARRPWLTIGIWIVVLVGAFALASDVGNVVTQEQKLYVDTDSQKVVDLYEEYRPEFKETSDETLIIRSTDAKFGETAFDNFLQELKTKLAGVNGLSGIVIPSTATPQLIGQDKSVVLAQVKIKVTDDKKALMGLKDAIGALNGDKFSISLFGNGSIQDAMNKLSEESLIRGEIIGISVALVILMFVFGALVASGIPILIAISSILIAVALTVIVGQFFDLSFFIMNMITMVGLALGIDYTLIAVQRFRDELRDKSNSVMDAIIVTGNTASRAVLFSGITVILALSGMLFVPSSIMSSLGSGAILVAIGSILTSLTLLPAILRLLGHKVNKGHIPFSRSGQEPRFWKKLAETVLKIPAISALIGLTIMVALALPALSLRMSFPGLDALPKDNEIRQSSDTLTNDFDYGQTSTLVVVENAKDAELQVKELAEAIEADDAFSSTTTDFVGNRAFILTMDVYSPSDIKSENAVNNLRTYAPEMLVGTGAKVYVGGGEAGTIDFKRVVNDSVPIVLTIVLTSSFIVLMIVFRSIVVPIKAILLNLLSTSAAYGALVMVFQWGWGAELFGFTQVNAIAPWLPLFLFSVLFGLSMDYHVFLLSRVKEDYDRTQDTQSSIVHGLSKTGSLITGAAAIMLAVFSGFALGDVPELAQMGFGLAVAVILDATIVRVLLVPSLMSLLGNVNWYLPKWLKWLPDTKIE